jgi:type I restriction enzyme, S subunit
LLPSPLAGEGPGERGRRPMSFPRYESYKDSGLEWLGEVPEHWKLKCVRHLLRPSYDGLKIGPFGSQLTSQMLRESGYKVYGQENVIANDFNRGERFISEEKYQQLAVYELRPGDILITMMGTSGRCGIVPDNIEVGVMDSHLLRMRVTEEIRSQFLRLLIDESAYVAHQIRVLGKGSIMHGLNSSIIKELLLTIPAVDEQDLILSFLDRETAKIDVLIAEQQRLIELLKEKRQAVISHAVTKGLNPPSPSGRGAGGEGVPMKDSGIEWLGEVPAHWEILKGGQIGRIFGSEQITEEYVCDEGELPFIKVGSLSLNDFEIASWDWYVNPIIAHKCRPTNNYIVFPKRGAAIFTNKVNIVERPSLIDPNLMG